MFRFWKSVRIGHRSRRTRGAAFRSPPLAAQVETVEPRQLMSATAAITATQRSQAQPDTIDLAVRSVIYDPTRNISLPRSIGREQFQVDVKIEGLTGRVQNNPETFSITLYWSQGPRLSDKIGVAASAHYTINHERNHVGDVLHIAVPQRTNNQTVYRQHADATHLVAEVTILSGAVETDRSDNVGAVSVPTARQLASQILGNSRITLATTHASNVADQANAKANIQSVASGRPANLSNYGNAHGGTTELDPRLLQTMLSLARDYNFSVSEISGGSHSANSRHYLGQAFDINVLNGQAISSNHPGGYSAFINRAKALGASSAALERNDSGNGAHIHVEWPRDPAVNRFA